LRFELAIQDQQVRIVGGKLGTDLFAVVGRLGVCRPLRVGRRPNGTVAVLETARHHPTGQQRRVNIRRRRRRAGDAHKAMRAVRGNRNRTRLRAVFHTARITQCQARLIVSVELFKDQHGHRLAEIQRRFADRAEQITLVERRHANAGAGDIRGGNHARRFERALQSREVDAGEDMRCVRRPDEQRMRRSCRPTGQVCRAKIGCVDFGPSDFGRAVDASAAGGSSRIPAPAARQGLTGLERRTAGKCRTREAQRDTACRCQPDELAA
jgi:hypothetical protein